MQHITLYRVRKFYRCSVKNNTLVSKNNDNDTILSVQKVW